MKRSDEKKVGDYLFDSLSHSQSEADDKKVIDSFMKTLKHKRLLSHGPAIIRELTRRIDESLGNLEAELIVKEPLSESTKKTIEKTLKHRYKAETVHLIEKIDHRIIGGVKIKINDEIFDATIKNRLVTLAKKLSV